MLLRDDFECSKSCLDLWLTCMLDCIHIYVFPFLKNYFKVTLTDPWHLPTPGLSMELFSWFLSQSRHLSIARWINREISCLFISSSIHRAYFAVDTFGHLSMAASAETFKARHLSRYLLTPLSVENYWTPI